ncbi:Hypp7329 [Branchiostoma lanceolatum]|uniref:Hypp7329 protein n=1 Tax=Branchiostoma lanceolatum TaxID=7740 RepID=A0A8J9YZN2_BRALA|nr:Hypp7329 [Branchiostoma lanceolatum]
MVSTKIRLSIRAPKISSRKKLYWKAVRDDEALARKIDTCISQNFAELPEDCKSYSEFVRICNEVGSKLLPRKPPRDANLTECPEVVAARRATLRSATSNVQAAQTKLRETYDKTTDNRICKTLQSFEVCTDLEHMKAWKLIRELSGKKSGVIFIQGEDRLNTWKNHFSKLLSAENPLSNSTGVSISPVFNMNNNISCDPFSQNEVDIALKQMKPGKAPGLDGLPLEVWQLPKTSERLTFFCNQTLAGHRPPEWGRAGIVPVPKKGNLTLPDNYRGISLTQVAAKVYNRLILNRLRPFIDKLLRPNQNGFRPSRSTSGQILALRRIVEEVQNHQKEAVLIFIDFKKAFDSINRTTMFEILLAYGIPTSIVNAIKIMYDNTSATVLTPEGETDFFKIDTGVLQGDPLAPFLFIIVLDYALRKAINADDGLTLQRRRSSRHPAVVISDLDFADDIGLLEDTIQAAQDLLYRVERATQEIGLYLNSSKTKVMHINPSDHPQALLAKDGSTIERVSDFKYLGSYSNSVYDVNVRIGQAWGACHALTKVWKAPIQNTTKQKVFKACVEAILIYGSDSWTLTKSLSKKLDGNYTRLLRYALNVPWQSRIGNKKLYNGLPPISRTIQKRRLALAGHVARHEEMAAKVLLWEPDAKRKRGRPNLTLKKVLEEEVGLKDYNLLAAMLDRNAWLDIVNGTSYEDDLN